MMAQGIRFYKCLWSTCAGYRETIEAAHHRRYLVNQIKKGELKYVNKDGSAWELEKIQETETPMIEIDWLLDCFTTGSTKKEREAHKDQAAYVIRLVEKCAARVAMEGKEEFIER